MKEFVIARMCNSIAANPPWCKKALLLKDELVMAVSADNLPDDSPFRWWVHPLPGSEEKDWHDYAESAYGVGAGEDDLEIVLDIRNELHRRGVEVY